MVLPLIPVIISVASSAGTGIMGYVYMKVDKMQSQLDMLNQVTEQAMVSGQSVSKGSYFSELLAPIAESWSGSLKGIAL
eukprot:Awhi_evm1s9135